MRRGWDGTIREDIRIGHDDPDLGPEHERIRDADTELLPALAR